MYVRWQRRPHKDTTAVLVESIRVNGKPRQRHIAYLGSFGRWLLEPHNVDRRAQWWRNVTSKLDALGKRVSPDDRRKIEAALTKAVPRSRLKK
jgi:hypothetical protein